MLPFVGLIIAALCYGVATATVWEGVIPFRLRIRRAEEPLQFWMIIAIIAAVGTIVSVASVTGEDELQNVVAQ